MSEAYYEGMTLEQRARVAYWALAPMAARGDLERPADQDVLDDLFEVGDVQVSEEGPLTDEDYRALIRACLRELDEERKTIRVVMARLRLQDDEHNYETQAGKDSRVLRSLLPETEGEA